VNLPYSQDEIDGIREAAREAGPRGGNLWRAANRAEALNLLARVRYGDELERGDSSPYGHAPRLSTQPAFGTESVIRYAPDYAAHAGRVL